MSAIGGPDTASFSLTPELLAQLDERVAGGQLALLMLIVRHGRSGVLVRFGSGSEALVAKVAPI